MTTRLATPRNFVLSTSTTTTTTQATDNCASATISSVTATSRDNLHHASVDNVLINEVDTISTPTEEDEEHFHFINDEAIESAAQLQEVLNHRRKLANSHEINDVVDTDTLQMESQQEVAVISVVLPMDATDSNSAEENSNIHLSAIKDDVDLVQQVANGQVTVVQAQPTDSDEGTPHYITVTVSAQDAGQNYQVQYVDTELYHSNSSQTQMTYPFCPVTDYQTNGQTTYYSTAATSNYASAANANTPTTHATTLPYLVPVDENLLLNSSSHSHSRDSPQSMTEVAYIQEAQSTPQTPTSTTTTNSMSGGGSSSIGTGGGGASPDCERNTVSNTNKIALATIKWLSRNYETADGVSLPRSTLYNHYIQHCNECKLEPVNAASFGKLIRSVFTGLRTRRLGTRGNSKYHYYGIRVKPGSILNHIMDDKNTTFTNNMPASIANNSSHNTTLHGNLNASGSSNNSNHGGSRSTKKLHFKPETYEACAQFLGDGGGAIPPFPPIELDHGYHGELTRDDVETFRAIYREHCESFLDAVLNLEFATIEYLWRDFWRNTDNNNMEECGDEEKFLSMNKSKLYLLCQCAEVQKFIKEVDYQFYQNMVDVIIPDVLRSIPNALTQAIRNFAKNLEIWLCESMVGVPERFVQIKTAAVSAFCQTLRRYTSLNHLAQAARAVLQNSTQISQMLSDLNRVDFHNVQEQAAWVCQCEPSMVQRLESDFKAALQQQSTLEQWASWLQLVVDSSLQEYRGKPSYAKAARQFLLKWSFYSSMVIRDLTLRSASSFGSFHLIRLLYDEYMFYLVEHKIAEAQQKTAIAVLCDRMKKDVEFDFEYQLDLITNDTEHTDNPLAKRLKHE